MQGQIVGGKLSKIDIREKNGSNIELGELLVVEIDKKTYSILQIKDIIYKSQEKQSTHEYIAGYNLEYPSQVKEANLENKEPEMRNYILVEAKALLHVIKDKNNNFKTISPKRLPPFFNTVRSINEDDLEFLDPKEIENELYLGKVRSGSKEKNVDVFIDAKESLTHHILIPATTGRGKSNLVKVLLTGLLDFREIGILVLDPHDEYYGRDQIGLKNHKNSKKKLDYYSTDPPAGQSSLIINLKSLRPKHVYGLLNLSTTQKEAIDSVYNQFGENWIVELFKANRIERVGVKTLSVLKRKFDNVLGVYIKKYEPEIELGYRSPLFRGGSAGETTVEDIIDSLEQGKTVIIDSSKLSGYEELLVGSIILEKLFFQYKNYSSSELHEKPVISVVIEEAPRVLGTEALDQGRTNIYSTIAREGRKFQIGLIAITQLSSLIPRSILANMNTKIILGNEMALERNAIIDSASQDLSDDNRIIASLDKGEAIVSSIFTRFAIPIKIPEFEKYMKKFQKKENKSKKIRTNFPG
ncbi:MAG TPA: ATP-binding protein [Methanobacterium subterraneum]|uniref:ATP-binding protein n=1 Tax=Methanobacterium subterraneum TaxID=59277 RepID=A0A7J4TI57_9EURY|nr:ATP-binding protein [Methanobacterium subterraneum]